MKRLVIFIPLFILSISAVSQDNNPVSDSLYIKKMNDKLSLKLDVDNDIESFRFLGDEFSFSIRPNIDFKTGLSFNYRFVAFKISYAPNMFSNNNDDDTKGKTKSFIFQTDLYIKNWIQTLEYARTKGYYISDIKDSSGQPPVETPIINPDLKTTTYRGATRYKVNPHFSLKSLTTQTEIQKKSAGSFIPGITYEYHIINNKMTRQDLNTFSLLINAGYFHTFVLNHKWYAGFGISPGAGLEYNKITLKTDDFKVIDRDNDFILNLDSAFGIGFNSNRFFSGAFVNFNASTRRDNTIIQFDTYRTYFQVFIGYRFKAPKFLNNSLDWMEEKSPFK
jgi:hypothetical protein